MAQSLCILKTRAAAANAVLERVKLAPIDGIIALGDRPVETAALVAQSLALSYNSPESVMYLSQQIAPARSAARCGPARSRFFCVST